MTKVTRQEKMALANRIMLDKSLDLAARAVGWYIADHINTKRGYAWPPQEKIASDLGICERSVRYAIKALAPYFAIDRSQRQHEYHPIPANIAAIDTGKFFHDSGNGCTPKPATDVPPSFLDPIKHPLKAKMEFDELGKAKGRQANPNGGFVAPPGSAQFSAWKTYCTDHPNVPKFRSLKRELENRELSGKPFNSKSEWPPA